VVARFLDTEEVTGSNPVSPTRETAGEHKVYKHGVAKSSTAAARQVRAGYGRPAVKPLVYRANLKSDRDKDGTACEA
jgi:Excalibur calcium-binding domain